MKFGRLVVHVVRSMPQKLGDVRRHDAVGLTKLERLTPTVN